MFQLAQSRFILEYDQLLLKEVRRFLHSGLHHVTVSLDDEGVLCATAKLWHRVTQSHLTKCRQQCHATNDSKGISDEQEIDRQVTNNALTDDDPKFVVCAPSVAAANPLNDWIKLEKEIRQFVNHSENRYLRLLDHNSFGTNTPTEQLKIQQTRSTSLTELYDPMLGSAKLGIRRWASSDDVDRTNSHADSFFTYNSWFDYFLSWRTSESSEGWDDFVLCSFDGWNSKTVVEAVQLQSSMSLCVDRFEQSIDQLGEVTRDVLLEENCLAEPTTSQTKVNLLEQVG
ncbi:hypothetical protein EG68_04895 [Paragonimus skrjabini miyazakii]|uniref:Uncharacterized protein n=1 Tax=Paragonimus skrjabini miyazakii TaxID=59628 RepID=A0A8S9Z2J8_9TREM|nr:hypothetical protein EG68_04895 [Paragonimus skrjabini miyazakii]